MSIIQNIFIYPVKSLGAFETRQANALNAGFEQDRRWMLINEKNEFVTQRTLPQLSLFIPTISGDRMTINYGPESIHWNRLQVNSQIISTQVWDDKALTYGVDDLVDEWFSDQLHTKVKLVKLKDETSRQHYDSAHQDTINVSLADGYPYLIVSQSSLDDLNNLLESPVSMSRFRPNIVISGSSPYEEDIWKEVEVGRARLSNVKPCARCQVINIDPVTCLSSKEPTKTLSTYRKQGHKIIFGSLYRSVQEGLICVGDEILWK